MVKQIRKQSDGLYHIKGKTYEVLAGSRAQVHHGTAYKTTGGLTKSDLMQNKSGRIVSRKKYNTAKREKRLEKAGYFTKKGKFGSFKRTKGRGKASTASPKKRRGKGTKKRTKRRARTA